MLVLSRGELLFQRRELGKGRVGIDRPIAVARRGARCILPMRRAAIALVAPSVAAVLAVTAIAVATALAFVFAVLAAVASEFLAALVVPVAASLAIAALDALVVAPFVRSSSGVRWRRRTLCRYALARLVMKVLVAAVPMMRPLLALACSRSSGGSALLPLFVLILALTTMALMPWPAIVRAPARPPDLDQFRCCRGFVSSGRRGRSRHGCLCRCFARR